MYNSACLHAEKSSWSSNILKVKSAVFIKPEISLFRLPTFLINYKNGKQEFMQLMA